MMGEDLVAYVDGELLGSARARFDDHVATCLTCRREAERLAKLRALVSDLPRIEPSAEFEAHMWRRMARETSGGQRRRRPDAWRWAVPVLAAAAVVALALYGVLQPSGPHAPQVATAPAVRKQVAGKEQADTGAEEGGGERTDVASADNPAPEDLPPELVEHPELFLRFPVVRRLQKLEHFEEVRQRGDTDPAGDAAPEGQPLG
jgi:RNA polymerase sigma-70 factor (ECF subfamily)